MHPVIELGRALQGRGHAVTVVTNPQFEPEIAAYGLGFRALGTAEEAQRLMRDPRLWHPRSGFTCIVEGAVLPLVEPLYRIIEEHRGPGLVVAATSLCLGARLAQERLGVPTATLHLQPAVLRSEVDNATLGPFRLGPGTPALAKRAFFWALDTLWADRITGPRFNAFRGKLGLRPVRRIFGAYLHSPQLVLCLFPEWFARRQPDWPAAAHLTGFLLHDGGEHRGMPERAEAFLAAGEAPVLVTPGSAATDRTAFFAAAARACARQGVRAMFVTNHPEQVPRALPEGIEVFPYLPFSRVLPRCRALFYHGGIGTLAQAVRAGVPHLVVPNAHDQPDNGRRIAELGIGQSLSCRAQGGDRGAAALAHILGSAALRDRCRALSRRIDNAAAANAACDLIETLGSGA